MTVLTVTNLPAATHGETVRCLFAIELSRMSWVIAFNTPLSEKISRRTLIGCKWKRLLELIEEVRARVSRETGRAVEVISCYEAGYDGFWLHRQLSAHGIRNYVIDPASLQVDRRARRVKTDRIDGLNPAGYKLVRRVPHARKGLALDRNETIAQRNAGVLE